MTQYPQELVEALARDLCDAVEPRVIAEQTEAPCFDDSETHVQDYWRSLAITALSKLPHAVDSPSSDEEGKLREFVRELAEWNATTDSWYRLFTGFQTKAAALSRPERSEG